MAQWFGFQQTRHLASKSAGHNLTSLCRETEKLATSEIVIAPMFSLDLDNRPTWSNCGTVIQPKLQMDFIIEDLYANSATIPNCRVPINWSPVSHSRIPACL